jgi:hypothetical protein
MADPGAWHAYASALAAGDGEGDEGELGCGGTQLNFTGHDPEHAAR